MAVFRSMEVKAVIENPAQTCLQLKGVQEQLAISGCGAMA